MTCINTYICISQIGSMSWSQALKSHGADFSFAAGQVQGGKMLYTRLVRTFALAHVRPPPLLQAVLTLPTNVMSCMTSIEVTGKDHTVLLVCILDP